jgi:hypothetical protein
MSPDRTKRHLPWSALDEYLAMSAPATFVVPGDPVCRVVINPRHQEMTLRTPHRGGRIDLADFEHVDARIVSESGTSWSEFIVDYREHGHEAYLLLSDVADMIQQSSLTFENAVRSALTTFEALLARAGSLSAERQTGLYGELLFLESCLQDLPADTAVGAWKGFASHEHDFVFPAVCFEVKTTKTERRRHQIGSMEQLQPIPGAALWVVSVQLTSASRDSGRTLAELVDDVRKAAGSARSAVDAALTQVGWRERDRPRYRDSQTLRTIPAAYLVNDGFPVLSRKVVEKGSARSELIVDANYTIDITALAKGNPPSPADHFVEGGR